MEKKDKFKFGLIIAVVLVLALGIGFFAVIPGTNNTLLSGNSSILGTDQGNSQDNSQGSGQNGQGDGQGSGSGNGSNSGSDSGSGDMVKPTIKKCPTCVGTGKVTCSTCGGSAWNYICNNCGFFIYQYEMLCPSCHQYDDFRTVKCICDAHGKRPCPKCGGDGQI